MHLRAPSDEKGKTDGEEESGRQATACAQAGPEPDDAVAMAQWLLGGRPESTLARRSHHHSYERLLAFLRSSSYWREDHEARHLAMRSVRSFLDKYGDKDGALLQFREVAFMGRPA